MARAVTRPLRALRDGLVEVALVLDGAGGEEAALEGVECVAVLPRGDARECFVSRDARSVGALPAGAAVAVLDERAALLLRALRGDVTAHLVESANAAWRMLERRAVAGALVGWGDLDDASDSHRQPFEEWAFLPPPGRGAATLYVRAGDETAADRVARLDDPGARAAMAAEAAVAEAVAGRFALGVYAVVDEELLAVRAMLGRSADGRLWFGDAAGPPSDAAALGRGLAARLFEAAAADR